MNERDIRQKMELRLIAECLKKVFPDASTRVSLFNQVLPTTDLGSQTESMSFPQTPSMPTREVVFLKSPHSTSYETPKRPGDEGTDDDDKTKPISKRM
jgi:hypothetical protein